MGDQAGRREAPPSGGAVDLSALRRVNGPAGLEEEVRKQYEHQAGMRCGVCGDRLTHGFEFHGTGEMRLGPEGPVMEVFSLTVHGPSEEHPDCYVQALARKPTAVREVKWLFLDDPAVQEVLGRAEPEG